MSATVITVLLVGSLIAGWVDAVVGGGGLILVPLVMILNPQFSNAQALSLNKVAAIFGTGSAAITLARKVPSARTALKYAPLAFFGAAGGAVIASSVDKDIMRPIIIAMLVAVGIFVAARPSFGQTPQPKTVTRKRWLSVLALVAAIGVYDGTFGPGTGLFLILSFTTLLGTDFLTSAAWAKIINTFTNLGALVAFGLQGEVLWLMRLALAVTNVIGAQIGARMVIGRGAGFVRVVLLVVVVLMATKLTADQLGIGLN